MVTLVRIHSLTRILEITSRENLNTFWAFLCNSNLNWRNFDGHFFVVVKRLKSVMQRQGTYI